MKLVEVVLLVTLWSPQAIQCIELKGPPVTWPNLYVQQNIQSTLMNLDERLRASADNLREIRYSTSRWELSLDTLTRRLETLEGSVTQAIVSCELKNEMSLTRKFEAQQERLYHRLGYVEKRLETAINKLQGVFEKGLEKQENKDGIEKEFSKIGETLDEVKLHSTQCKERINQTHATIEKYLTNSQSEKISNQNVENIVKMLHNIHKQVNKSESLLSQNDSPHIQHKDDVKVLESIKLEINDEAHKIGNKVSNMYSDLWRRVNSMEDLIRNSISTYTVTKKELFDNLKIIRMDSRETEAHDMLISIDNLGSMVQRKLIDLGRKVDNNFQSLSSAQTMFMESCHRLQEEEPKLERKVSIVLEKILDTIINKTANVDKQVIEILEALKGHNSQILRSIGRTTNMVATLAEESSHDHKHLNGAIVDLSERSDIIAAGFQDLQDQIQENMNETLIKYCTDFQALLGLFTERNISLYQTANLDYVGSKEQHSEFDNNNAMEMRNKNESEINTGFLHGELANFSQGVVKILTEIDNTNNLTQQNSHDKNESTMPDTISVLNQTINEDHIVAVIHEPNYELKNQTVSETKSNESISTATQKKINIPVSRHGKRNEMTKNIQTNEESPKAKTPVTETTETDSNIVIRLLVIYMKAQNGHVTKSDFLKEVNPTHPYKNMRDLIKSFKGNKEIPTELFKNLEQWDSLNDNAKMPRTDIDTKDPKLIFNEDYEDNYYDMYPTETTS